MTDKRPIDMTDNEFYLFKLKNLTQWLIKVRDEPNKELYPVNFIDDIVKEIKEVLTPMSKSQQKRICVQSECYYRDVLEAELKEYRDMMKAHPEIRLMLRQEERIKNHCPKCKDGTLRPGVAMDQTWTSGIPDFPGSDINSRGQTFSPGGPGKMIKVLKCDKCGFSKSSP